MVVSFSEVNKFKEETYRDKSKQERELSAVKDELQVCPDILICHFLSSNGICFGEKYLVVQNDVSAFGKIY